MKVELAVGRQGGRWDSIWVNVPAGGKDPRQMSETELTDLIDDPPFDTSFVHLMFVDDTVDDEEPICKECGKELVSQMIPGEGKTLNEVWICRDCCPIDS